MKEEIKKILNDYNYKRTEKMLLLQEIVLKVLEQKNKK
jgi:hypothetical protein